MRISVNQLSPNGTLFNGYDYEHQAWVVDGLYQDCGHPQPGTITVFMERFVGCDCYGREHAGEPCTTDGGAQ